MPSIDDSVLLLDPELALSSSKPSVGNDAVLYSEGLGRGKSGPVSIGDDVAVATTGLGQGGGDPLPEGFDLSFSVTEGILLIGDPTTLNLTARNDSGNDYEYTASFIENDTVIAEETRTVPAADDALYQHDVTKNQAGKWVYSAGDVDTEIEVTWMYIDPSPLRASKEALLAGNTTTLSIDIYNPTDEDQPVTVTFLADGSAITDVSKTISPGSTLTYSLDQTRNSDVEVDFQAQVKNGKTGLTGTTVPVTVYWRGIPADGYGIEYQTSDFKNRTDKAFNSGDPIPAGDWKISVAGGGWNPDNDELEVVGIACDEPALRGDEFDGKRLQFRSACNAIFDDDTDPEGPRIHIGSDTFLQTDIFTEKTTWTGEGTFSIQSDTVVSVQNQTDSSFDTDDDAGSLVYILEPA